MFLKSLSPGHEWSVCQKYFLFLQNLDKSFIIVDLISSKNNFRNSKIVFCHLLCWCIYSIYIRWNHQLLCICNQQWLELPWHTLPLPSSILYNFSLVANNGPTNYGQLSRNLWNPVSISCLFIIFSWGSLTATAILVPEGKHR